MTCLAEEDVGGGVNALTGGGADGDLQEPAQLEHYPLHHPVVVEDLDEEAEEQYHRQYLRRKVTAKIVTEITHMEDFVLFYKKESQ